MVPKFAAVQMGAARVDHQLTLSSSRGSVHNRSVLRILLVVACTCMLPLVLVNPNTQHTPEDTTLRSSFFASAPKDGGRHEDRHIYTRARYKYKYSQTGWLLKETGRTYKVSKDVVTWLVHSFTPYVEREAAKRFLDPPHNNVYFANSPAVLWHNNQLIFVCRIWLEREKYKFGNEWPANDFADNYLYLQRFDGHMRPVTNGSIIGIPAPKQFMVGDGPIEPRLIKVKNRVFITFNSAMAFDFDFFMDFTIMWDLEQSLPIIPTIKGGSPMLKQNKAMPRDKHWMAVVLDNHRLFFVHSFDPLRIMKCDLTGHCEFLKNKDGDDVVFIDVGSHLRGGTPFEQYEGSYYISIAHATLFKESSRRRYYTAHLVVLHVDPFRVVYVSDDIRVHPQIYRESPIVRSRWIEDGFIFPVSLIIEDKDSLIIGVHVNDYSSVLLRMHGVQALLEEVIRLDKRQNATGGPPGGYLHKHVHDSLERITKIDFID